MGFGVTVNYKADTLHLKSQCNSSITKVCCNLCLQQICWTEIEAARPASGLLMMMMIMNTIHTSALATCNTCRVIGCFFSTFSSSNDDDSSCQQVKLQVNPHVEYS